MAALSTSPDKKGKKVVSLDVAEESIQKRSIRYDNKGNPVRCPTAG